MLYNQFKMRTFLTVLVLIFLSVSSQSKSFNLITHPLHTGARCLDGSPSALYLFLGEQKEKFLLYFEGGGVCEGFTLKETLKNCYQRSKTHLGSSKSYPSIRDFSRFTILSAIENQNPLYHNWTKVFIPYCDGSMHQGSRLEPVDYEKNQLFFRGANNTLTHFQYLDDLYGLFSAKETVVSGTSAGAQATMMWGNTIYKNSKHPEGVLLIADSGIFVSDLKLAPGIKKYGFISILANEQTPVPIEECQKVIHECTTAEVLADYIIPPIIILQSLYDVYSIRNLLQIQCPENSFPASLQKCNENQLKRIENHRVETLKILERFRKYKKNGLWVISCAQHGFLYDLSYYNSNKYLVPQLTGHSVFDFLVNFKNNASNTHIDLDEFRWPENTPCNGIINLSTE